MNKKVKYVLIFFIITVTAYVTYRLAKKINPNLKYSVGQKLDSLNGVYVYYNGGIDHVEERNLSADGYNLGLKYQCVEFVKRYYYEYYQHKMPDSYGNAKDFFLADIADGELNTQRALIQYTNPSKTKPCMGDLIIFDGHSGNKYGHVAIISKVTDSKIEIVQQNPGPFAHSRIDISLKQKNNQYKIESERVLGWLRKQ